MQGPEISQNNPFDSILLTLTAPQPIPSGTRSHRWNRPSGPSARITGPRRNGNHPTGTATDPDPTRKTGETDEKKKFVADAGVLAT